MALQHSFVLPSDLVAPAAYSRVTFVSYTKDSLTVGVETHASAAARVDNKQPISNSSYMLPWVDGVSLTYVYQQLKQLPDFASALDI